ncbi:MAG: hypothetical protein H6727_05190 [Myxococcales bacterium]|nr:hypothetical protein [Myxococcales bacterium]
MASREHLDPTTQQQFLQNERLQAQIRLSRTLSHDLNNIFMAILNYLQLVQENPEGKDILKDLEVVERTAKRGLEVTQLLQRFSRGGQSGPPIEVDLHQVLRQGLERWQERLGTSHPLHFEPGKQAFFVLLPPTRVEELLLPLLENAKEALPQGGTITISTEYVDLHPQESWQVVQPGPYVCLCVRDEGRGIPFDLQEIAIEPMATHHPRTTRHGMGLALVYSMVRQVSGWLTISSEEDLGTEIKLYLPLLHYSSSGTHTSTIPRVGEVSNLMLCLPSLAFEERDRICSQLEGEGYTTLEAEDSIEMLQIKRRFQDELHVLVLEASVLPKDDTLESLRLGSPSLQVLIFSTTPEQYPANAPAWQHYFPEAPSFEGIQQGLSRLLQQASLTSGITEDPRR